jgi:hypothetical protein
VDVKTPSGLVTSSADSTSATLEIATVWKGQVAKTLTLTTPGSSASCGITFEQGKEYVVYAQVSDGVLSTTLCSRTRPVGDAAEDVAALGAGQPPQVSQQVPAGLPATGAGASADGVTALRSGSRLWARSSQRPGLPSPPSAAKAAHAKGSSAVRAGGATRPRTSGSRSCCRGQPTKKVDNGYECFVKG